MDITVTKNGDVYRMIAHPVTEFYEGSQDSWYYYEKNEYDTNMMYITSVETA
jgi:hypothetical protein